MRCSSSIRHHAPGVVIVLLLMLAPALARAQCSVSGPDQLCGSAQLCGPEWGSAFQWSGPGGFTGSARCMNVTLPGTYTLRTFDPENGLWFTCNRTLTASTSGAPSASISGPTSACAGSGIELCGPTGAFTYAWSGPNFSSSDPCVTVTEAGTYSLMLTDLASGCVSMPATHTVSFQACEPHAENCPRPACFWARSCRSRSASRFYAEQIAVLAQCMDDRAQILNWSNPSDGYCATLAPRTWTLRTRAKRQFAAVLANVCASSMNVTPYRGRAVGLAIDTPVTIDGSSVLLSEWLSGADAELLALDARPLRDESVRTAYLALIREGWNINHGRGMGPVCGNDNSHHHAASPADDADDFLGDESLESALLADSESPLMLERLGPNPIAGPTVIAFTISGGGNDDVSIAVYDLSGRKMRELVRGVLPVGRHETMWDGRDDNGVPVRNGMYFVLGRLGGYRSETRLSVVR